MSLNIQLFQRKIRIQLSKHQAIPVHISILIKQAKASFTLFYSFYCRFIRLKCNPQLVLTVATPLLNTDPFSEATSDRGYNGSRVILGRRLDCYNGNSHQMFTMDTDIGFINAFSTDLNNMGKNAFRVF